MPFAPQNHLSQTIRKHLSCALLPPQTIPAHSVTSETSANAHVAKCTRYWIDSLVSGMNNNGECLIRISSMPLEPPPTYSPSLASAVTTSPTNKVPICSKVGARIMMEVSMICPIRRSLVVYKTGFNMDFPIWSKMIFKATISTTFSHNSQRHLLGVSFGVCMPWMDGRKTNSRIFAYIYINTLLLGNSYSSTLCSVYIQYRQLRIPPFEDQVNFPFALLLNADNSEPNLFSYCFKFD